MIVTLAITNNGCSKLINLLNKFIVNLFQIHTITENLILITKHTYLCFFHLNSI